MAMNDYEKSKFRFSEIFNNSNGKTSGTGFAGFLFAAVTTISFLIAMFGWWCGKPHVLEVLGQILELGLLACLLLGVRKVSGIFNGKNNAAPVVNNTEEKNNKKEEPSI